MPTAIARHADPNIGQVKRLNCEPLKHHPSATLIGLVLILTVGQSAQAVEIYHWVDENGVQNFSQLQPIDNTGKVSTLILSDTTPPDYDPDEDRYGIEAQAQRMSDLREAMAERRAARSERQPQPPRQSVPYRDPYRNSAYALRYPPFYPEPPARPRPPIAVPYRTDTLQPGD
jgi:hypothetical protein